MDFEYNCDEFGIIHQIPPEITTQYDDQYIQNYSKNYRVPGMSCLRLGYLLSHIRTPIKSIIDIGCGNGSFLAHCSLAGIKSYGYDAVPFNIQGVKSLKTLEEAFETRVDVVTFFDSLEHFKDISIVLKFNTKYIVITAPDCHYDALNPKFMTWKHRKPGEHLHHFNVQALNYYMIYHGWYFLYSQNIEDSIRGLGLDNQTNTFTSIYVRDQETYNQFPSKDGRFDC